MGIHVTDEMVARYLSGKATPEEESAVLDYMSENDEHIEDLLAMTAAVEQFVEHQKVQTKQVRPLWPVISAAASVALLIGVGIALWHNSMSNGVNVDPAPSYAEQDTMDTVRSYE